MRPFMRSVLLIAVIGLCLCAVQAATPAPTWGTEKIVKASSSTAAETTLPTVAGLSADTTSTAVSKVAAQITRPATSPTVRATTIRIPATSSGATAKATTPRPTATPTTPARTVTEVPTAESSVPVTQPGLIEPLPTDSYSAVVVTPLPADTMFDYLYPVESRTPDIDPGMTPYSGPTELETKDPTPAWEVPVTVANVVPTDPQTAIPFFTAAMNASSTFELPPGAYVVEQAPTSTGTMAPIPTIEPPEAAGSSFLPRWLSYLLFVILGIAGVAGLAVVGSHVRSRPLDAPVAAAPPLSPAPVRDRDPRLLRPGSPEPTIEQQILIDRVAAFDPKTMHVERLGRNLLRLEHAAQVEAQDRSVRLGRLLVFDAIPSVPVPAHAAAWARAHGFRVLAVDGFGMALLLPALPAGGRSVIGVLPVRAMVEGESPVPMSVQFAESERGPRSRRASPAGVGVLQAGVGG